MKQTSQSSWCYAYLLAATYCTPGPYTLPLTEMVFQSLELCPPPTPSCSLRMAVLPTIPPPHTLPHPPLGSLKVKCNHCCTLHYFRVQHILMGMQWPPQGDYTVAGHPHTPAATPPLHKYNLHVATLISQQHCIFSTTHHNSDIFSSSVMKL